jgi:hypothetical protein
VRHTGVWIGCVLATCAVAGCTSDTPAPDDTSQTSLTTTYSPPHYSTAPASTPPITTGPNVRPGEKPPTFPKSLETNVPSAAGAFAVYWEKTIDWGYATVDSSLPRTVYSASCAGCERFMKIFDGARADGVHFRGGRLLILSWTIQPSDHHYGATAVIDVTFSIQALQAINRTGKVVESDPAVARTTDRVWVRWTGTRLTVVDWKHVVRK